MNALTSERPRVDEVLGDALLATRDMLGLSQEQVAKVIGVDRSTISRLGKRGHIDPASKSGELALMLIRVYRSLYAMVGGSPENLKHWMRTENFHLGGRPCDLIQSVQGLTRVLEYIDAIRGKV